MEKLPERIKSIRERIYRGELQFERMRDETVLEILECREVIECLQIEIIELQNHIDGNGLFFKDFFKDTYFELFAEEDNAIEKGCATEKKQKQYDPF